jgi:hypothetical protein
MVSVTKKSFVDMWYGRSKNRVPLATAAIRFGWCYALSLSASNFWRAYKVMKVTMRIGNNASFTVLHGEQKVDHLDNIKNRIMPITLLVPMIMLKRPDAWVCLPHISQSETIIHRMIKDTNKRGLDGKGQRKMNSQTSSIQRANNRAKNDIFLENLAFIIASFD